MATIAPSALVTLEEYLRTAYHPDLDFIDGVLEERNMGEQEHSDIQGELVDWFNTRRDEWNIRVNPEYRTRVARVRIPDVTIISRTYPREPVRQTPALLCIEVLSPEDRLARIVRRLEDYLAMGVSNLWVVDPYVRVAYTYSPAGLLKVAGDRIEIPGSPIFVHLPTIFSALD